MNSDRWIPASSISFGTVKIDTSSLPSGVFLYRTVDRNGRVIVSGRWVKE